MAGSCGNLDSSSVPLFENSFSKFSSLANNQEMFKFQKIIKTFYKAESLREDGTLPNFRALLGRRSVTEEVKAINGFRRIQILSSLSRGTFEIS